MHRFFVVADQVSEGKITVTGSDVNHMKNVLRIKPGENLLICDGNNKEYECSLDGYENDMAVVSIVSSMEGETELSSKIYLFQGIPKGEKMEFIVQKAVELGVTQVIPVEMKRCVVKLDVKKAENKRKRWQAIAEGAAKQAGRNMIPEVTAVMNFHDAIAMAKTCNHVMVPYELAEGMKETKEYINEIHPGESIAVFIGPEGGFEQQEVEEICAQGGVSITLGKRILRTETAGLTILSILMFHLSE